MPNAIEPPLVFATNSASPDDNVGAPCVAVCALKQCLPAIVTTLVTDFRSTMSVAQSESVQTSKLLTGSCMTKY
eukprot:4229213-Lingulodinium_polyedra.AAC.1